MGEVERRTPFDWLAKGLFGELLPLLGLTETSLEVGSEPQWIDISLVPDPARAEARERLGLIGRMAGVEPCIFEPFSRTPSLAVIRSCVRKQYTLDHMRARAAARQKQQALAFPRMWVLSPGTPRMAIEQYWMRPMAGWPTGFWEGPPAAPLHVVVLRSLPRVRETLLLRLMGRGATLHDAIRDLHALPGDAWERQVSMPLLIAFRFEILQDSLEAEDMHTLQEIKAMYAEWERQVEERGEERARRNVLIAQLGERFGPLPVEASARIENASVEELDRWIRRVVRAPTLAEVLED